MLRLFSNPSPSFPLKRIRSTHFLWSTNSPIFWLSLQFVNLFSSSSVCVHYVIWQSLLLLLVYYYCVKDLKSDVWLDLYCAERILTLNKLFLWSYEPDMDRGKVLYFWVLTCPPHKPLLGLKCRHALFRFYLT